MRACYSIYPSCLGFTPKTTAWIMSWWIPFNTFHHWRGVEKGNIGKWEPGNTENVPPKVNKRFVNFKVLNKMKIWGSVSHQHIWINFNILMTTAFFRGKKEKKIILYNPKTNSSLKAPQLLILTINKNKVNLLEWKLTETFLYPQSQGTMISLLIAIH